MKYTLKNLKERSFNWAEVDEWIQGFEKELRGIRSRQLKEFGHDQISITEILG